jgi:hypothetical protein
MSTLTAITRMNENILFPPVKVTSAFLIYHEFYSLAVFTLIFPSWLLLPYYCFSPLLPFDVEWFLVKNDRFNNYHTKHLWKRVRCGENWTLSLLYFLHSNCCTNCCTNTYSGQFLSLLFHMCLYLYQLYVNPLHFRFTVEDFDC